MAKENPTPKRKDKEKENRRPIIIKDKKEAKKRSKILAEQTRQREYEAMQKGDINNMPERDKGPEKAYIRDFVDYKYRISEFFMLLAILMLIIMFIPLPNSNTVSFFSVISVYIYILACIIEMGLVWFQCKKGLKQKFGEKLVFKKSGYLYYMSMRMLQFRKLRLPKTRKKENISL